MQTTIDEQIKAIKALTTNFKLSPEMLVTLNDVMATLSAAKLHYRNEVVETTRMDSCNDAALDTEFDELSNKVVE